jgi:type II secretory pathway component GspD/PulD (secretin)
MKKIRIYFGIIFVFLSILTGSLLSQEDDLDPQSFLLTLRKRFPEAKFTVQPFSNRLYISAPTGQMPEILKVLEILDKWQAQVTIEIKLVEIIEEQENEVSVNWVDLLAPLMGTVPVDAGGGTEDPSGFYKTALNDEISGRIILPPTTSVTETNQGGGDFRYSVLGSFNARMVLHALEASNNVNVLSVPKVTTETNQTARIEVVKKINYIDDLDVNISSVASLMVVVTTYTYEYSFAEENSGVIMDITPEVLPGSQLISLDLRPEIRIFQEMFSGQGITRPIMRKRNIDTSVMIKSGSTVVVGGLIEDRNRQEKSKVPVLGSIPLLGYLFRSKYEMKSKVNLVIFIKAYIIDPMGQKIL